MVWFDQLQLPKNSPNKAPRNPEKRLWTGFSSGNVLHVDRKEAQPRRIHQGLAEVLFPVPERG